MNTRVISTILFIAAGLFCGFRILYDDGIVGMTKKPNHIFINPGCICHGDSATASTRVWIEGSDSVRAGQVALFKISVARDSSVAAGFNVAAFLGSLEPYDTSETQLMEPNPGDSLELTHIHPKLAEGRDTISWFFYYHAPVDVGSIDTIYANGNSVDLSLDPDGDYWNFAPSFLVRIVNPTDVHENAVVQTFRLGQNYPNPFNPSTVISFEMPIAGLATLTVYDLAGKEVRELVNGYMSAGLHKVSFVAEDVRSLSSGVYLYRLVVQNSGATQAVATRKMLLLK
jgi:hypothetical protein